jgi:hypothetical protein
MNVWVAQTNTQKYTIENPEFTMLQRNPFPSQKVHETRILAIDLAQVKNDSYLEELIISEGSYPVSVNRNQVLIESDHPNISAILLRLADPEWITVVVSGFNIYPIINSV